MNTRTLARFGLLAAALAVGCAPLRGVRSDSSAPLFPFGSGNSAPPANVTPASGTDALAGGTVVAAGGGTQPGTPAVPTQQPPSAPSGPLAMPRPTSAPGDPQQPVMMPPVALPGSPQLPAKIDPHVRNTPTAAGGRLGLAPYEVPTDRVVELTLHLERLLAENRTLVARIKELETAGLSREQALAEAAREVESVTADAARTRAALQAQIVGLQGRVRQLEEEDIIFLRAVIDALSRLLPPEKKP